MKMQTEKSQISRPVGKKIELFPKILFNFDCRMTTDISNERKGWKITWEAIPD